MTGLNHVELFAGHQTCGVGGTSTIPTALGRGSIEGVNKNSPATSGDMRTLSKVGQAKEVLHFLHHPGIWLDSDTYVCLLQKCTNRKDLAEGKQVHTHIIQSGFKPNIFLLNTLVNMYAKCGSTRDSREVFDKMSERNAYTWTIMIAGYAQHGFSREALEIYEQMQQKGVMADKVTFISVLNACASLGAVEKGREVHADIIKARIAPYVNLENTLVDMYAKCGSMEDASQVFNNMAQRNVVSWNTMIAGYAQHGCWTQAFEMYRQMQDEGVRPDRVTFICVLNACASLGALEKGKEVHAEIIKAGVPSYLNLENTLVDMYAKCGSMMNARQLFDNMVKRNVVSWTAMIAGCAAHQGCGREAFNLYEQMQQEGVTPNRITFISVLHACANLGVLEMGKKVHADIIKAGIVLDSNLEITLVNMFFKCGSVKDARQVFDNMAERDVVSWSAMIAGYAQGGCGRESFKMYEQMLCEGVTPNSITFICILNACASLGALEKGIQVHADIMKAGILSYINLDNALINMYAKCGSMKDARQVFDNMAEQDVVSWTALIAGYAQHGCVREVLELFQQMQLQGLKPDGITFISLLSACSHVGLVDEGRYYFDSMSQDHGVNPTAEHFGCMVDLLGRAGRFDEAEDLINKMPTRPDVGVWRVLLGASRIHGNVKVAERATKSILQSDPQHPGAYVLLSNIYAATGRWEDKAKVRKMMDDRGIIKERGCIDIDNQVHTFVVEDNLHPQSEEVHVELKRLCLPMREAGYRPDTHFLVHDLEEKKEIFGRSDGC